MPRLRYVRGPRFVQAGTLARFMRSPRGKYGLISTMGEPSNASNPSTTRVAPLTEISRVTHNPMGFGRLGLLVANTPTIGAPGCRFGTTSRVERWLRVSRMCIQYRMIRCEKPRIARRPSTKRLSTTIVASSFSASTRTTLPINLIRAPFICKRALRYCNWL